MGKINRSSFGKLFVIGRQLLREHSWRTPIIIINRFFCYVFVRTLMRNARFSLGEKRYRYALHLLNGAFRTERVVEIPIAIETCQLNGEILEVGNVLNQYFQFEHEVVDKYEKSPGVINEDIATFTPGKQYDLIISISTLEHVGWDESLRRPDKLILALENLKLLLKPEGRLIVTVPLGYNSFLDEFLRHKMTDLTKIYFMKRISALNEWAETDMEDALNRPFGSIYPCANAIAVLIYEKCSIKVLS
ncbi:MAG: hypothetical protein WC334_07085 [Kiritimatiellales bacterium]